MKAILLGVLLAAAGCVDGGESSTERGRGQGTGDGTPDELIDAGAGTGSGTCTGAAYDPCSDPTECLSERCQLFAQAGIQVCTVACTPGDDSTCPELDGQPAKCNNRGICKPPGANSCTR